MLCSVYVTLLVLLGVLQESELSALPSSALLSYKLVGLSDDEFVSYNQSTVWCRKGS